MGKILTLISMTLFVLAVNTASAQSSHPPLEGGVTPPTVTVTSDQIFYASLWCRDFDSDEFGAMFCNNLTAVTVKALRSGTTVYFAHTSFENCKHTFTHAVRARAVTETQIYLDVYEVADMNAYLNDGKFDVAMIVTVTPPPPTDPPGGGG